MSDKRESMLSDEAMAGDEWRVHECLDCGHEERSEYSASNEVSVCAKCGAPGIRLVDGWRSERMSAEMVRDQYEALITKGDLIRKRDLDEMVRSLIQTVSWNACHETMRACAKQWGFMDERGKWLPGHADKVWPPHPQENTIMRDGGPGTEKDFTKP